MTASSRPVASPPCSIRCGSGARRAPRRSTGSAAPWPNAIATAREADLLRVDHLLHLRCEVPMPDVVADATEIDRPAGRAADFADGSYARAAPVPRRGEAARLLPRQERRDDRRRARCIVRRADRVPGGARAHELPCAGRARASPRDAAGEPRRHHAWSMSSKRFATASPSRSSHHGGSRGSPARRRHPRADGRAKPGARRLARRQRRDRRAREAGVLDILSSDYVPASLLMAALQLPKRGAERSACRPRSARSPRRRPKRSGSAIAARSRPASAPIWCASVSRERRSGGRGRSGAPAGAWHELVRRYRALTRSDPR